ncbi:hypothetical protein V9T40_006697 [Parthenolecanium corni]|uniref:Cytoplasmic polyadenylation element-binding protein ZZ domain-containing protein n=1 Tax=Parthenolecanium corni TaxID=536013 RepID=A0AAN9U1U5_9HEMI
MTSSRAYPVLYLGRDWYTKFPYETPLSTTLSSPNQQKYTSAILNLTGKENLGLGMNLDSNGLESPIIETCDSSISTGSLNSDMSFFPNSIQTCRSDSLLIQRRVAVVPKVKLLLESCREGVDEDSFYYIIPTSRHTRPKEVQLDPYLEETPCSPCHIQLDETTKAVFLGEIGQNENEKWSKMDLNCDVEQSGLQIRIRREKLHTVHMSAVILMYFFKYFHRRTRPKEVQVIPWSVKDSNYSVKTFQKLDPLKTIFVGALHGMMNAEGLFRVMNDFYGGVLYTGIDTTKNKYPSGSGRTPRLNRKVQLDPYLEETPCNLCHIQLGPYFCRGNGYFRYLCTNCWSLHNTSLKSHKPLMGNSKHGGKMNAITVLH